MKRWNIRANLNISKKDYKIKIFTFSLCQHSLLNFEGSQPSPESYIWHVETLSIYIHLWRSSKVLILDFDFPFSNALWHWQWDANNTMELIFSYPIQWEWNLRYKKS